MRRFMLAPALLFVFVALSGPAVAGPLAVTFVVSATDGTPIPGASVHLAPPGVQVKDGSWLITDSGGRAIFKELSPGTYSALISLTGFAPVALPELPLAPEQTLGQFFLSDPAHIVVVLNPVMIACGPSTPSVP